MQFYQAKDLTAEVGARTLFHIAKLGFHYGDRIGLIGGNGVGKTTLLTMLAGLEQPSPLKPSASKYLVPQLKPTKNLSGGQIVQHYLDAAFETQADILFLDEPTANLDVENVKQLENSLKNYPGTLIMVSHDRAFLDRIVTHIWALADQKLTPFVGNYSDYLATKSAQENKQWQKYHAYTRQKQKLALAAAKREQKAARAIVIPQNKVGTQEAYKSKPYFNKKQAKLAKTAKAIEKRATKLTPVDHPEVEKPIKMQLNHGQALQEGGVLTIEHFKLERNHKVLINDVNLQLRGGEKLAITGPNGSGKTTLLESIVQHHSSAIHLNDPVHIGYFQQDLRNLVLDQSILENVLAATIQNKTLVRTVLARLGFKAEQLQKQVKLLSGGERVKVSFAKLFLSQANFLILDEPTNYLDIVSLEALEQLMMAYPGTVLIVSHDRYFIKRVATRQLQIEPETKSLIDPERANDHKSAEKQASVSRADKILALKNQQTALLGRLTMVPDDAKAEKAFLAVSQALKALRA
ncbi:ribosomal protection-like ABC-F family protein [Agrilactobacillus fermenti]|uniref:ribosomal protection-like ABC-F family protein n=1 Tax=Agrilactobacillus fermenti TaxID=2586909 RepID=UPI003A5BBA56